MTLATMMMSEFKLRVFTTKMFWRNNVPLFENFHESDFLHSELLSETLFLHVNVIGRKSSIRLFNFLQYDEKYPEDVKKYNFFLKLISRNFLSIFSLQSIEIGAGHASKKRPFGQWSPSSSAKQRQPRRRRRQPQFHKQPRIVEHGSEQELRPMSVRTWPNNESRSLLPSLQYPSM